MKKIFLFFCLIIAAITADASTRGKLFSRNGNNPQTAATESRADGIFNTVSRDYADGRISADSVVNLALYHKVWSPALAERCLGLVADKNARAAMELGVIYAFSPEYAKHAAAGAGLLQAAADAGVNDARCYLGLYHFNRKDYAKAKACFDACRPVSLGIGHTALGSMYMEGKGVREDVAKAREYYCMAALEGYPRGAALYGFNLRATAGGPVSYPDSFFWLYIAGDLGDDAARTALYLPRGNEARGDSEVSRDALTALQMIATAQSGKKIQNEPIYKDGFLKGLKDREKAAEQGDDWSRYYLGSMNYNGDFLNQNYKQALRYYEPVARNAKLPATVLAVVNRRLAEIYGGVPGVKADAAKAAGYARRAAHYGSLSAYKAVEHLQ
ncbi:MAG: hypothetical protein K2K76_10435 [Muribaculaceae bacterium]|nr:hypothetical protein [Muribaculaceae bacterium]